ncbi:MAG: ATP-dependent zinc protease [Verrucomicrobiae bacterium]|nr:ATP-dependent zinc protease [Verrucomicrobiae bacterium]
MKSSGPADPPPVVGWREWLSIPDLGILGIKAKIDTGARSSALHTHDYEVYEDADGEKRVRFHLHPVKRRPRVELSCDSPVSAVRTVKDSGGHVEERPFILARVCLGAFEWPVEVSLTNRESMRFRMLLGRTAIAGHFAVDPGRSYLQSRSLLRSYDSIPVEKKES